MTSVDDLLDPAQTNLRLYEQLRHAGRGTGELAAVRRAYELAMRLFAGQYRANGKTFIAHLVGTASILACLEARPPVVIAGLLHSAYTHGRFGGWRQALTPRKRDEVRAVVGAEVEDLVLRYTTRPAGLDRDVVLMRLANELEELIDLGPAYCAKPHDVETGAEELGLPLLAAALARARQAVAAAHPDPTIRNDRRSAFTIAPATHRERLEVRLFRGLARLFRR